MHLRGESPNLNVGLEHRKMVAEGKRIVVDVVNGYTVIRAFVHEEDLVFRGN